jgi:hypothetical protein
MAVSMVDREEVSDELVEETDKREQMVGGMRRVDGQQRLNQEDLVSSEDGFNQSEVMVQMGRWKVGCRVRRCDPIDDCVEIMNVSFLRPD